MQDQGVAQQGLPGGGGHGVRGREVGRCGPVDLGDPVALQVLDGGVSGVLEVAGGIGASGLPRVVTG